MKSKVFEGIKVATKERQKVLANPEAYNVGFEFEFNTHEQDGSEDTSIDSNGNFADLVRGLEDRNLTDDDDNDIDQNYIDGEVSVYVRRVYPNDPFADLGQYVTLVKKMREMYLRIKDRYSNGDEDQLEFDFGNQDIPHQIFIIHAFTKILKELDIDLEGNEFLSDFDDLPKNGQLEFLALVDASMTGRVFWGKGDTIAALAEIFSFLHTHGPKLIHPNVGKIYTKGGVSETDLKKVDRLITLLDFDDVGDIQADKLDGFDGLIDSVDTAEIVEYIDEYHLSDYFVSIEEDISNTIRDLVLMVGPREANTDDMRDDVEENTIYVGSVLDMVETDHDEMVEVITKPMHADKALIVLKEMFEFMSTRANVYDYAGCHVSISTNKHDLDNFRPSKFIALMDIPFLLESFPERNHVESLYDRVKEEAYDIVEEYLPQFISKGNTSIGTLLAEVGDRLDRKVPLGDQSRKYYSINFGGYNGFKGRIEMRFFGGEDYHERYEEFELNLLRALHLLDFAYTDAYDKVYYKKLLTLIDQQFKHRLGVGFMEAYGYLIRYVSLPESKQEAYMDKLFEKMSTPLSHWFSRQIRELS